MLLKKYLQIYRIIFLIVLVSNTLGCSAKESPPHYKSISNHIDVIYKYLQKKDFKVLNKQYVNSKYGLYIIYRPGAYNMIKKINKIDEKTLKEFLPFFQSEKIKFPSKSKQWRQVSFSCDTEKWSSEGYFLQKIDKTKIITNILQTQEKYFKLKSHIKDVEFLESRLYHYTDTVNGLDLYLKNINGKWYILIWDTTASDCSA